MKIYESYEAGMIGMGYGSISGSFLFKTVAGNIKAATLLDADAIVIVLVIPQYA